MYSGTVRKCVYGCEAEKYSRVYRFPKDQERAFLWLEKIGRDDLKKIWSHLGTIFLCDNHFSEEFRTPKGLLRRNAVPDRNIKERNQSTKALESSADFPTEKAVNLDVIHHTEDHIPFSIDSWVSNLQSPEELKKEINHSSEMNLSHSEEYTSQEYIPDEFIVAENPISTDSEEYMQCHRTIDNITFNVFDRVNVALQTDVVIQTNVAVQTEKSLSIDTPRKRKMKQEIALVRKENKDLKKEIRRLQKETKKLNLYHDFSTDSEEN